MADANTASGPRPSFPLTPAQIEGFVAAAPTLGAILNNDEATSIVAAYEREDARAMQEQAKFVQVARRLNQSVLATAIIGSAILACGVLAPWARENSKPYLDLLEEAPFLLGIAGLISSALSAAWLYELNAGDLARYWMESRARAEKLRSEYFDFIAARAVKEDGATRGAAVKLVSDHLLMDQLNYFNNRGDRHVKAAGNWLQMAAYATGFASFGVAAGGMAGVSKEHTWLLALAALGAIGSAVVSYASSQEAMGQERERANRFRNNRDALELLARQRGQVRDAAASNAADALVTFTSAINQQLSMELGRFLKDGDAIRASLDKLTKQIEEGQKKQGG